MDADAKLDATLGRKAGVALDQPILHLDSVAHRVDHAAKLNDAAITGVLHHAPVMHCDAWIDQIAAQRAQPCQYALLVGAGKSAVADHIRHQNRRKLSSFGHDCPSRNRRYCSTKTLGSLSQPTGWHLTGINIFANELAAKRLELLRELLPGVIRIAVLVDPANARLVRGDAMPTSHSSETTSSTSSMMGVFKVLP